MSFHSKFLALLTLFTKINVQVKGLVKLKIVWNVVQITSPYTVLATQKVQKAFSCSSEKFPQAYCTPSPNVIFLTMVLVNT